MLPKLRMLNGVTAFVVCVCTAVGPSAFGQAVVRASLGGPVDPAAQPMFAQAPPTVDGREQAETAPGPGSIAGMDESRMLPITLSAALRMAATSNLDIAQSREVVRRAEIQIQKARLLLVPNLNVGTAFAHHEGQIQKTEGNIITANKDSLWVGGGPSMTVSFADAVFAPLVARQVNAASAAGLQKIHNDTLLAIAEAYFTMVRAQRRLARAELTLDFLTSEKPSPLRAGSKGLLPVITALQKAGAAEALKTEVYRVEVDVLRRREERTTAMQEYQVASAELARLIRIAPGAMLWPLEDFRAPLELTGPWQDHSLEDLVRIGLNNRPDLAENQALVRAAVERVRQAKFRPLLPNLVANYNWGGFGGGPDQNPPKIGGFGNSGVIHNFNTRTDYDLAVVWRLQNFGFGNRAEIREQESFERQASLRQLQLQDIVTTQIIQTLEQIKAWQSRVAFVRAALYDSSGRPNGPLFESARQSFERIREIEKTRPLEVLDSLRRLADLLEQHATAATDYERARFRLLVVLGLPAERIIQHATVPLSAPEPAAK